VLGHSLPGSGPSAASSKLPSVRQLTQFLRCYPNSEILHLMMTGIGWNRGQHQLNLIEMQENPGRDPSKTHEIEKEKDQINDELQLVCSAARTVSYFPFWDASRESAGFCSKSRPWRHSHPQCYPGCLAWTKSRTWILHHEELTFLAAFGSFIGTFNFPPSVRFPKLREHVFRAMQIEFSSLSLKIILSSQETNLNHTNISNSDRKSKIGCFGSRSQ